ncbi:MAG: DUF4270 family protein [Bacteroidales bacterium]|nr:DUF4270 family protein [Bacteroidales bacterium]
MNKNIKTSNPEKFSRFFSVLIVFVIMSLLFSCEENPSSLGAELISSEDKIGIQYDTTLTFNSYLTSTTDFNSKNLSNYSIGNFQDPFFGEITGSFAGQFVPLDPLSNVEFENLFTEISIDSTCIIISYNNSYGSPLNEFDFKVYELNDSIPLDAEFRSNTNIKDYYSETDIISSGMRNQGDSMLIITLKESFYSKLIDINNNFYLTTDAFITKFYGMAIIPEEPDDIGGLYNINVIKSNVKMYFFKDSVQEYSFSFYSGQRFGQYNIDFKDAEINTYNNPETPSELIFLQGLGGIESKIVFSNYKSVFSSDFAYSILRAELSIPVYRDPLFEICPPPERLYFYKDTNYTLIEDANNSSAFDGYFNEDNFEYNFNISKHVKDLFNGNLTDSTMHFGISSYNVYPNRVILKTGENIKLRVTYTKH